MYFGPQRPHRKWNLLARCRSSFESVSAISRRLTFSRHWFSCGPSTSATEPAWTACPALTGGPGSDTLSRVGHPYRLDSTARMNTVISSTYIRFLFSFFQIKDTGLTMKRQRKYWFWGRKGKNAKMCLLCCYGKIWSLHIWVYTDKSRPLSSNDCGY